MRTNNPVNYYDNAITLYGKRKGKLIRFYCDDEVELREEFKSEIPFGLVKSYEEFWYGSCRFVRVEDNYGTPLGNEYSNAIYFNNNILVKVIK